MSQILVGCCGYSRFHPPDDWKQRYESKLAAYSDYFPTVELNRTFYELPMIRTCERWRGEVREGFEFTVKAWQALTHPLSSPTWRGRDDDLTDQQREEFGYLRPNESVRGAWQRTLERVRALRADVCLLQTPPSFDCTPQHESDLRGLLESIDRDGIQLAWEHRGDWSDNPGRVRSICEDLDLVPVVDPLRREPVVDATVAYTRLHGLNEDSYDYDYDYSSEELERLSRILHALSSRSRTVYCMFNNYQMYSNARELMERLGGPD